MSYAFPKDQPDGAEVELANGVKYKYSLAKNRWSVASINTNLIDMYVSKIATAQQDMNAALKAKYVYANDSARDDGMQGRAKIIAMAKGGMVTANFSFERHYGQPSSRSQFTTNNTDPRRISKLYMDRGFMDDYILKAGYVVKEGGIISIQDASSNNVGFYHCVGVVDNGGSDVYFNVAGTGTSSSFAMGAQYKIRVAVTFPT